MLTVGYVRKVCLDGKEARILIFLITLASKFQFLAFNQWVTGSNASRLTNNVKGPVRINLLAEVSLGN